MTPYIYFITAFLILIPYTSEFQINKLNDKVKELIELSTRKHIIRLDQEKYKSLLVDPPRNYSVILMLTALNSNRQCYICRAVQSEFSIVANSWKYSYFQDPRLFFAFADFDESPSVFQSLGQSYAPLIVHFPAKKQPSEANYLDITRLGYSAEAIAKWIYSETSLDIHIFRPPNYAATMLLAIFLLVGVTVLYFKRHSLDPLFARSNWAVVSIGIILCMVSGQVFNHIKGPPVLHADPSSGSVMFVYPGGDFQFVAETFVVLILYLAVVAGALIINECNDNTDASKRKLLTMGGLGIFSLFFVLVLSIFRRKYQGYPYSLL